MGNKKALIINAQISEKGRNNFNILIKDLLKENRIEGNIVYADNIINSSIDKDEFSFLIISGSAACAMDNDSWNSGLQKIIRDFVNCKKSVLGICYGHQFLAKTLCGIDSIGKSHNPEVGFASVNIKENELFKDIVNPVFSVSHYDEVKHLNEDFSIIADSKYTEIQAYQYRNLPVWGVQFHPEYGIEKTEYNIQSFKSSTDESEFHIMEDLKSEDELLQNRNIFRNFFNSDILCMRPHHLLCFQTYIGKGYSAEFVENMDRITTSLKENPDQTVRLVKGNEHVCCKCPNNTDGIHCESEDKVNLMDQKVLDSLGIDYGIYRYSELLKMKNEMIDEETNKNICKNCQWYDLCFKN